MRVNAWADDMEQLAHALRQNGVRPTYDAIIAALRGGRVPDVSRELRDGYCAACARWGANPEEGDAMLDPSYDEAETVRPPRAVVTGELTIKEAHDLDCACPCCEDQDEPSKAELDEADARDYERMVRSSYWW